MEPGFHNGNKPVQSVSTLRVETTGCIENTETDTGLCVH